MVNWEVDPHPHVPKGFKLVDHVPRPSLCHEVFMAGCFSQYNKDLVTMKLQPSVHKDDFDNLSTALCSFFEDIHQVHAVVVQLYPLGDAYVRFNTALERENFLVPCSVSVPIS